MEFFKPGRYFDFMGQKNIWFAVSVVLCLTSLVMFFTKGLNFGTDFRGGTEIEIAFKKEIAPNDIRNAVQKLGFSAPDVIHVTDETNPYRFMLRVQEVSTIDDAMQTKIQDALCFASASGGELPADRCPKDKQPTELDMKVEIQLKSKGDQLMDGLRSSLGAETVPDDPMRVEWVGPKAGKLLRDAALKSVGISLLLMMAYVAFRFDMRFAPGAIVALAHDVLIVTGIFVVTGREFTLTTVAALLTLVGYSINDTVVVYDRIRENLGKHRGKTFTTIINISVSEVISRTILTSTTTLLSLMSFLILGSGAIKDFAFALFLGIIVGTYSSIYIASPLTEVIDRRIFGGAKSSPGQKSRPRKREAAVV